MTKTTKKTAKKTAKKAAKTVTKTVDTKTATFTGLVRKGTLAYVGLHGAAFERAKLRYTQLRSATDGLFDSLVEKGEGIEAQAGETLKDAQARVRDTYSVSAEKVRNILPSSANDRVAELQAEVDTLNKKIVTLAKKAKPAAKAIKAEITTDKVVKSAPVAKTDKVA